MISLANFRRTEHERPLWVRPWSGGSALSVNKISEFIAPGLQAHVCATCPHIDTSCLHRASSSCSAPISTHSTITTTTNTPTPTPSPSPAPGVAGQPQSQVPWRALFLFMPGRHKLTMLHHVQSTCGQANYRGHTLRHLQEFPTPHCQMPSKVVGHVVTLI